MEDLKGSIPVAPLLTERRLDGSERPQAAIREMGHAQQTIRTQVPQGTETRSIEALPEAGLRITMARSLPPANSHRSEPAVAALRHMDSNCVSAFIVVSCLMNQQLCLAPDSPERNTSLS